MGRIYTGVCRHSRCSWRGSCMPCCWEGDGPWAGRAPRQPRRLSVGSSLSWRRTLCIPCEPRRHAETRGWVPCKPSGAREWIRMAIVVVGLNHTTAPVAVRERLAFSDTTLAAALLRFQPPEVTELVILSTCNRVELYVQTDDVDASTASGVAFLAACHDVPAAPFVPHPYQLSDLEAVRHLFRVAASLDSLVLGEPQILGQVKAAYLAAQAAERTGVMFSQLFERALSVAKAVRSATGISDHAVSVSYAAVELAKKIFESLQQRTVMVLGAGETAELAARHLVTQGVTSIFI